MAVRKSWYDRPPVLYSNAIICVCSADNDTRRPIIWVIRLVLSAADSIKDQIEAKWKEDKAVEKLEALVNEKGDEYKVTSKKEDYLKELNDSVFSTM